jgi:hypothetical protein
MLLAKPTIVPVSQITANLAPKAGLREAWQGYTYRRELDQICIYRVAVDTRLPRHWPSP